MRRAKPPAGSPGHETAGRTRDWRQGWWGVAVAAAAMVVAGLAAAAALPDAVSVAQPLPRDASCAPSAGTTAWVVVTAWVAAT